MVEGSKCQIGPSTDILEDVTAWTPFTATTVNGHEAHLNLNCKYHTQNYGSLPSLLLQSVILTHPNTHEEQRINSENTQYDAGVQAGHAKSLNLNSTDELKCPSGHNKSFCSGWATTAKYNVQEPKIKTAVGCLIQKFGR